MITHESSHDTGGEGGIRRLPESMPGSAAEYDSLLARVKDNRDGFWRDCASQLVWDTPFDTIVEEDFTSATVTWFKDGTLNAAANALDWYLAQGNADAPALSSLSPDGIQTRTYGDLLRESNTIAQALAREGLSQENRVALYLPDCTESVVFMLACARLGITIVPIPLRFTAEVTAEIISDSGASLLLVTLDTDTASYGDRVRTVMAALPDVPVINTGAESAGRVKSLAEFISGVPDSPVEPVSVPAEHPLLIIYANSASGVPRGSVLPTGGFLVQSFASSAALFEYSPETTAKSVFCTLELASAAGQCYGLWGTLLRGGQLVLGGCNTPINAHTLGQITGAIPASALFTTPGTLATLRTEMGTETLPDDARFVLVAASGDTLLPRLITFAGDALTTGPERVLNLWIQSETGAALISTYPTADLNRPGALGMPFPGIEPVNLNNFGDPCRPNESGQLVFASSWPAMIRTIWGQHERYRNLYFRREPGSYSTNDGVRVDGDGFYWFMGRLDDVVKVRSQSLATSEVEAVLVSHLEVSEAAVVNAGADKLDLLFAFVVLAEGRPSEAPGTLEDELRDLIIRRIGEFAVPTGFFFSTELPRTRTGKIVRRVLRRVAGGDIAPDEDLSHVANPQSVEELIRKRGS